MHNKIQFLRIEWIDIARGITMFLVIIGHTIYHPLIRGLIFSFHMPLFFIFSGALMSFSSDYFKWRRTVWRLLRSLVLPGCASYICCTILMDLIWKHRLSHSIGEIFETLLFSSGVSVYGIEPIGMVWFFIVLFFGRIILDLLHFLLCKDYLRGGLLIGLGLLGSSGIIKPLPFSLDIVLVILIFMEFGGYILKIDYNQFRTAAVSGVIFVGCFFTVYFITGSYLELAARRYPMMIISYIGAYAGTVFLSYVSVWLNRHKCFPQIKHIMALVGAESMTFLLVHYFDCLFSFLWNPILEWGLKGQIIAAIIRLSVDLILFVILIKFRAKQSNKLV